MSSQSIDLTREEIIARNLAAVDVHFHNENPDGIDRAVGVYTDDIIWEVPARGLVLRDRETVKQEYLNIFRNCPFPAGTRCSIRLVHAFQCRDGKICRENGYEIWRRADDTTRVQDDIPATATVEVFD
jgi:hypothetical protein